MCEIDRDSGTTKDMEDLIQDKVEKFTEKFHRHGLECGQEIAKVAKEMHPNAIAIIPLYRSCVVIEQGDMEKRNGIATIHSYADPHWLGRDIDKDTLMSDHFHTKFIIQGYREGPEIYLEHTIYKKTEG